jgi:hypothetical protein
MSDQAPAALINDEVVTYLSSDRVREIVSILRETGNPRKLVHRMGDGNNAHDLVKSMVHNNVRLRGQVVFDEYKPNSGLAKALAMSPVEVINEIKTPGCAVAEERDSRQESNGSSLAAQRAPGSSSSATATRASPGPSRTVSF